MLTNHPAPNQPLHIQADKLSAYVEPLLLGLEASSAAAAAGAGSGYGGPASGGGASYAAPVAAPAAIPAASSASSFVAAAPVKAAPNKSGVAKPVAAQFVGLTVEAAKDLPLHKGGKEHRALISEIKAMLKVVNAHEIIKGRKTAVPFQEPVNREWFPDYYQIITQPMDLSTISTKNKDDLAYTTCESFKRDMYLIFDNAITYNSDPEQGKEVRIMANTLKSLFNVKYEEMVGKLVSIWSGGTASVGNLSIPKKVG